MRRRCVGKAHASSLGALVRVVVVEIQPEGQKPQILSLLTLQEEQNTIYQLLF